MVRLQTLDLRIGVRVPASQPLYLSPLRKRGSKCSPVTLWPSPYPYLSEAV